MKLDKKSRGNWKLETSRHHACDGHYNWLGFGFYFDLRHPVSVRLDVWIFYR